MSLMKSLAMMMLAGLLVQCSSNRPVRVWVEEGSGRDALRFGVGHVRGVREGTPLKSIGVRRCEPATNPSISSPSVQKWLVVASKSDFVVDSTFVYGIAPQGLVTDHEAEFLEQGCYTIVVHTQADSARACFLVSSIGDVTQPATPLADCRRDEGVNQS